MSTNYYFRNIENYENLQFAMREMQPKLTRLEDKLEELNVGASDIHILKQKVKDILEETYPIEMIHIGKRSAGWKPLFQKHESKFDSVKSMKQWYMLNCEKYEIVDEYNRFLSWKDLNRELIDWKSNENYKSHFNSDNFYMDRYINSEGYEFTDQEFS